LYLVTILLLVTPAYAEDGAKLWLRYARVDGAPRVSEVVIGGDSATSDIIRRELRDSLIGISGQGAALASSVRADDVLIVGTPESSPIVKSLPWADELEPIGREGFIIRAAKVDGHAVTVIAASRDVGALYGTFHFLRLLQTGGVTRSLDVVQRPRVQLRVLDHWDNLDGSIERGYAGKSLWKWDELPQKLDPRYEAYARANASIGINGAVLNNVNAKPEMLTRAYLEKVAALANVFRPYGVRVYLSASFATPKALGDLSTADPLDPQVAAWWKAKADEIYTLIPDFGGFLVKANSEGQPGPQDYQRTHADGANMLADALAPHGGVVMWRAFVYDQTADADRVKRAYKEFVPLDGKFRKNVVVQVKNGPLDFMPREPFHPLFGAMRQTPVFAELQVTQEYLGHSKHLVYLAPVWKEFFDADTFTKGEGTTVAKIVGGETFNYPITGVAGVANTGSDANWTGHHFGQANWYAFGRLAWDPNLSAEHIADEWLAQTFSTDADTRKTIRDIMLGSREAIVNYSMPLGLHHLIAGDHYAPAPWNAREPREDWTATYYPRADKTGVGFDRTAAGSNAVEQYAPPVRDRFADVKTCPENLLLWFHRLPWDHKLSSARTLWDELRARYDAGAADAARMRDTWRSLDGKIDPQRHREIAERLDIQAADATKWRDECVRYFRQFAGDREK
jgi:alpha-glucuronidase